MEQNNTNGIYSFVDRLIERTIKRSHMLEGDYRNADGIVVCGKCNTPKEFKLECPKNSGNFRIVPSTCKCDVEKEKHDKEMKEKQRQEERISYLQKLGLTDKAYLKNTFQCDDSRNQNITQMCKNYIAHWKENSEACNGILFYGDTGAGKSFYACCIANELIKQGYPVLVSRVSDLVNNRVDKNAQTIDFKTFKLIVIDDIGVENATQTAYNIIDDIYRANIPLIITTNLTPSQLKNPDTIDKRRIYDRVLERCCITQKVDVTKSRLELAKEKQRIAIQNGII